MGSARGLSQSIRFNRGAADTRRRTSVLERQQEQQEVGQDRAAADKRVTSFMKRLEPTLKGVAQTVADHLRKGGSRNDPALQESINAIGTGMVKEAMILQRQGDPGALDPQTVENLFKSAVNQASPEEQRETSALDTEAEAEAKARGTAAGTPKDLDVNAAIDKTSRLVMDMLQKNIEPSAIKPILEAMIAQDPDLAEGLGALMSALPDSQAAFTTNIAMRDMSARISAAQPLIDELMANGIDRSTATMLALAKTNVNVDANPQNFSPGELKDIRDEIRIGSTLLQQIENVIPLINDNTVGLLAGFSENVGGVGQQIPGINAILNTIGGPLNLDEKSVKLAQVGRSRFRALISPMAKFIIKNQRLSNQQLDLVNDALSLLKTRTSPDEAKTILTNFAALAKDAVNTARQSLDTGGVGDGVGDIEGDFIVTRDENGKIVIQEK